MALLLALALGFGFSALPSAEAQRGGFGGARGGAYGQPGRAATTALPLQADYGAGRFGMRHGGTRASLFPQLSPV